MPPSLVLLTDADRNIVSTNAPARAILGCCQGKTCCQLFGGVCPVGVDDEHPSVGRVNLGGILGDADRSQLGEHFVIVVKPRRAVSNTLEALSPREREVLTWVSKGLTDIAVADRLGLQPTTVRSHMESVRKKFQVRSRSQAVAHAAVSGLL